MLIIVTVCAFKKNSCLAYAASKNELTNCRVAYANGWKFNLSN
jgi:hypothetical protein